MPRVLEKLKVMGQMFIKNDFSAGREEFPVTQAHRPISDIVVIMNILNIQSPPIPPISGLTKRGARRYSEIGGIGSHI